MTEISLTGAGWRIDESVRTAAIAAHDIGELIQDQVLTRTSDFAAALCDAPVALIGLIEEQRHLFLARTGTDQDESPRDTSFCAHAMLADEILLIPDTTLDPQFMANALVTGPPYIRFYAGVPLVSADGVPLGALCVIDFAPRAGLTALQRQGLTVLAENVMARLGDSKSRRAVQTAESDARRARDDSELRFRTLADTMPQMVWSTLPDGYHDYYNARWYEFTGVPVGSTDGEEWNGMFHPEDQERAWAIWRQSLATGDPYQIEYRLRHADGSYRWTLGRALPIRAADGAITRWFGTCTDIHEQKRASEEREIVAQELSHRIKNIFSVIAGLISFSARAEPGFAPLANALRERITALGRAHDFVRPHSAQSRPAAPQTSLHGLLDELFKPYGNRIVIIGNDVEIDDRSATPIALLFHELATNAIKYGALSADAGSIALRCETNGDAVSLHWEEQGGPAIARSPERQGFGSQLIDLSVVRQLGGSVAYDWCSTGLKIVVRAPRSAFSR